MATFTEREIQYVRDCISALPENPALRFFKGEIVIEDDRIDLCDGYYSIYVDDVVTKIPTIVGIREVEERVYHVTRWVPSGWTLGEPDEPIEQELIPQDKEFHRVLCEMFANPLYQQLYAELPLMPSLMTGDEVFADNE